MLKKNKKNTNTRKTINITKTNKQTKNKQRQQESQLIDHIVEILYKSPSNIVSEKNIHHSA